MNALIGYTGFVGSNLKDQLPKNTKLYNSKNIEDIKYKAFDDVYFCGISGYKYIANINPTQDMSNIIYVASILSTIKFNRLFVVSSQDCNVTLVSNCSDIGTPPTPYGRNRLIFENIVTSMFDANKVYILRIGCLFGKNIKKNIIYDLLNNNYLDHLTDNFTMQLYDLNNLANDFNYLYDNNIHLANIFSEPVYISEIINIFNQCGYNYQFNLTLNNNKSYNNKGLLLPKDLLLSKLKDFINAYRN